MMKVIFPTQFKLNWLKSFKPTLLQFFFAILTNFETAFMCKMWHHLVTNCKDIQKVVKGIPSSKNAENSVRIVQSKQTGINSLKTCKDHENFIKKSITVHRYGNTIYKILDSYHQWATNPQSCADLVKYDINAKFHFVPGKLVHTSCN